MDSRKVKICYYLAEKREANLSVISDRFNKSERTIRNDIDEINSFLEKVNLNKIDIDNNKVSFDINKKTIFKYLNNLNYSQYYLDSIERRVVIILYGIVKGDYFTINELSEFMNVSRSTVINDLDRIKIFINSYGCEIITEPSIGTKIKAFPNSNYYDLINDLVTFDVNNISRFINQDSLNEFIKLNISKELLGISNILHSVEIETDSKLTDYSYKLLKYFLLVYLRNIKYSKTKLNKQYDEFINLLLIKIEDSLSINLSEKDLNNIVIFIKKLNFNEKNYDSKDKLKAQIVTGNFIESVSNKLSINFTDDEEFLKNLANHLSEIIDNPIIKVKEYTDVSKYTVKFPELKNAIVDSLYIFDTFFERKLNNLEIDFIVVYFVAALEKMKNSITDIRISLICPHGIGTSYLIKENLKAILPNLDITLTKYQKYKDKIDKEQQDLILSTVQLDEDIDYLLINPILDLDSMTSILNRIDEIKMKKIKSLEASYKEEIQTKKFKNGAKLSNLLIQENIKFNVKAENWKEAISISAEPLLKTRCIDKSYIDAMIKNIDNFGPYIIIADGIALPHASSEAGVNRTSMSLIKLDESVYFNDSNQLINFFICLSTKNNEHFNAFTTLINGLRDKEILKKFKSASNSEEMYKVILNIENKYGGEIK
ncbi:MAG: PTS sugar transporter subunit IIA [Helcococcus sp.]|nr:PTS sugar transporter subunit IIA [Helcococcus sp.]